MSKSALTPQFPYLRLSSTMQAPRPEKLHNKSYYQKKRSSVPRSYGQQKHSTNEADNNRRIFHEEIPNFFHIQCVNLFFCVGISRTYILVIPALIDLLILVLVDA